MRRELMAIRSARFVPGGSQPSPNGRMKSSSSSQAPRRAPSDVRKSAAEIAARSSHSRAPLLARQRVRRAHIERKLNSFGLFGGHADALGYSPMTVRCAKLA
jgi:hypothetical protein